MLGSASETQQLHYRCSGQASHLLLCHCRFYHHTGMISNWYGIREALAIASAEGLEAMWARHRKLHLYMWEELSKLGLEPFVEKEHYRLVSVNTIKVCCAMPSPYHILRLPRAERGAMPCIAAMLSAGIRTMNALTEGVRTCDLQHLLQYDSICCFSRLEQICCP